MNFEYLKSEVNNAQFNFEEFRVSDIRSLIEKVEQYEKALKEILKVNTDSYEEDLQKVCEIAEKSLED